MTVARSRMPLPTTRANTDLFEAENANRGRIEQDLIQAIWRRQYVLWLTVCVCVSLALLYLIHATPIYTSTARLYVEQNGPAVLNETDAGTANSDSYLYTQCELLRSAPILALAVEELNTQPLHMWGTEDSKIAFLKGGLETEVGKKDQLISVTFDSPFPDDAARIVNAVVDGYVLFTSQQKQSTAGEVLKILQKEKDKCDAALAEQDTAIVNFKRSNANVFFENDRGNIVIQDLAAISAELTAAKIAVATQQSLMPVTNNVGSAKAQLSAAFLRQQALEQLYDQQQRKALDLNTKAVEYGQLAATEQRTEKLSDELDSRIKELSVTEDTGALNVSILEPAKPSPLPSRPQKATILASSCVLGLLLGCGIALTYDWLDQRIRSVEEVQQLLGLNVLTVVPTMPEDNQTVAGRAVEQAPSTDVAEAFRSLRTAIYFGGTSANTKTILITSPSPGDGKSTSASNLAIAMAQAGQRTLLIDADLRRPTQHHIFGLKDEIGLCSVLGGTVPLEKAIQRTEIEGLDLLPCGPLPSNPSEILNSQVFADLLENVSERYEHLIFDSPPILPVTDARILGAISDATILILRADKSTRRHAEHAIQLLTNVNAQIVGAIVNAEPRRKNGYYRYGSYMYGYGGYNAYSYRNEHTNGKKNKIASVTA